MHKSLFLILTSTAIFSLQGVIAADLFDSPGPGYHQQIERLFPAKDRTATDRFKVSFKVYPGFETKAGTLGEESLLSRPIHLTLSGPLPVPTKR